MSAMMQRAPRRSELRWPLLLIGLITAYLGLFAARFADERLYADSGYYLMHVINQGVFRIEHGRWALTLSQALPLLGVKLGAPLHALILLHSLNNVLWLVACMLVAWRVLRAPQAAVAIAALHLIGLAHGLFCPIFELYYGADLLILFLAAWRAEHLDRRVRAAMLVALFLAVISCHLMGLALMAWALLLERAWRERRLFAALVIIGSTYLVLHALTVSDYEKDHLGLLRRAWHPGVVAGLFTLTHVLASVRYAVTHYPDVLALGLMASFLLLRDRGCRWKGVLLIAFLAALHLVIAIKHTDPLHDRYREQLNFPAIAAVIVALGLHAWHMGRARTTVLASLFLAVLFRVARAEQVAPFYTARTVAIEGYIAEARANGMHKAIGPWSRSFGDNAHSVELSWSVSVESLLLSSADDPCCTVSIITQEDRAFGDVAQRLHRFVFRRWEILPEAWLDPRWFTAPTGRYEALPSTVAVE